jgi:N-carbamoylputrescine amidase
MRTVSLAALQFSCTWTRDDNIAKADRLLRQAARQGAQVVLLPELFETSYFCAVQNSDYYDLAHSLSGQCTS